MDWKNIDDDDDEKVLRRVLISIACEIDGHETSKTMFAFQIPPGPVQYSVEELKKLKEKASEYCTRPVIETTPSGHRIHWVPREELPCRSLYRNNQVEYFNSILNDPTNPGWMKTTPKNDGSGDPRSPINQQRNNFCGMFFCATLWNGGLPTLSPYGPVRLVIPSREMLDNKRLYFADFYCTAGGSNGNHYIILVVTTNGSQCDNICQHTLVELYWANNPFLYIKSDGQLYVNQTPHFWTEIFFTEDIQVYDVNGQIVIKNAYHDKVNHLVRLDQSAVRKNSCCPHCNI